MKRVRIIIGLMYMIAVGCSPSETRKPTFPVQGKVVVPGKSAEHATVVLHPVDAQGPDVVKPRGKVLADGSFKLTTYETDDGAPAGKYQVTIEQWLANPKSDAPPSNRLPAKFARVDTSGITADIQSQPNTLPTFELK